MDKCVVKRAIKEAESEQVIGYELYFQQGKEDLYQSESVAADMISDFFINNSHKIFRDKQVFITLTPSLLFRNIPKVFDKEKVVIQIEDNVIIHPLAMMVVKKYYNEGYKFAINDFKFAPKYLTFLEYAEYIRLKITDDMDRDQIHSVKNIMQMAEGFGKKCIATDLNTEKAYQQALDLKLPYLEGSYIAETLAPKADKVTYMEGNFFELVVAVSKEEPDMAEIEEIVSRDAGITYALLKLVNSAYFALRRRTASIRQALMTMGIGQLRQWVYMLSFRAEAEDGSEEILRLSFLRANFAQQLALYVPDCPITKTEAYMMGMFSTLEYMVDAPIEELLAEIPVSEEIKGALISKEGVAGKLYELVISYENADWNECKAVSEALNLQTSKLSQIYIDCVEEVNSIWDNLTTEFEREEYGLKELEQ